MNNDRNRSAKKVLKQPSHKKGQEEKVITSSVNFMRWIQNKGKDDQN